MITKFAIFAIKFPPFQSYNFMMQRSENSPKRADFWNNKNYVSFMMNWVAISVFASKNCTKKCYVFLKYPKYEFLFLIK